MTLRYTLYFLSLIYVASGIGVREEEEEEDESEIRKDLLPVRPPNITVLQNQSGSLVIELKGDMKLKKEYADHHWYRILYKKGNGEFEFYDDILAKNTHVIITDLEVGVKYCFQMRYIVYHKSIKGVNDSTVECAVVAEKEESRIKRIAWVSAFTVILGVLLVSCCMWMILKNRSKVKRSLRCPLDVPDHVREFLSKDFDQSSGIPDSDPDSKDACDRLSVVTCDGSKDTGAACLPERTFTLEEPL